MSDVNQKPVCLVTGGSSGIGLATAKKFFAEGYRIAICGRSNERLQLAGEAIFNGGTIDSKLLLALPLDLADPTAGRRFAEESLEHFGRIDVLVNNAATAPLSPFGAVTEESFEDLVNLNIRSSFYLTQVVWNTMVKQKSGTIVNISSKAAVDPFPGFSLYGASKAWIDLLTHALGQEGADLGIRVCSIRPGAVETPLLRGLFPDYPADECSSPKLIADRVWDCVCDPQNHPSGSAFEIMRELNENPHDSE
jgi:NAD(P)-dependent dehydrogenase (short-subunit alcohol dehydrogenase family)